MKTKTAQPADNELFTLNDLAKQIGRRRHPHYSALWRACRQGKLARNGRRVFLRHVKIGKAILVRWTWWNSFVESCADAEQAAAEDAAAIPDAAQNLAQQKSRTEKQRQRDIQRSEQTCERANI